MMLGVAAAQEIAARLSQGRGADLGESGLNTRPELIRHDAKARLLENPPFLAANGSDRPLPTARPPDESPLPENQPAAVPLIPQEAARRVIATPLPRRTC